MAGVEGRGLPSCTCLGPNGYEAPLLDVVIVAVVAVVVAEVVIGLWS